MAADSLKTISRRDAIKLLGAAAGATVLANLPGKWSTPALTAGVLPAHAQTSPVSCQFDLRIDFAVGGNVGAFLQGIQASPDSGAAFPAAAIGGSGYWQWNCNTLQTTCIFLSAWYNPPATGIVTYLLTSRDGSQMIAVVDISLGLPGGITFDAATGDLIPGCP